MKYPIYLPEITTREKELVLECLDSTWISSRGRFIEEFERRVAEYVGVRHAIAVMNGTVALHLAVLAAGIGPGDEVILPDFTYIASANAVRYAGAVPVLADVDPETWNMGVEQILPCLTPRTKAIMTVDVYGMPPDMDPILKLARQRDLVVIEDAAESLGAEYRNRRAGNLGNIGVLSFFGNKTITTGEGGMVVTDDDHSAGVIRQLRNQGNSETTRYFHDLLGFNYRMTNIQAAIGCAQMERLNRILERKREIQDLYRENLEEWFTFQRIEEGCRSSHWMVSLMARDAGTRERVMLGLNRAGIETRPFFLPVHSMPFYPSQEDSPVTVDISSRGFNLPSYHLLRDEDVLEICKEVRICAGATS
ncbi:DegT/DnrJ/EryC1/StrS aminotransferase family protein [Geothrix sp. 21YS21S-4]|uniref:DegT/DnrJ/EryC1/StrS family aminotransferase n=1 Tax=Geothrix sp. 21YS21S-4 TaxID=3068889 RepID=UPI0027B89D44|nr:DegT/DnrJ/EryC1/StrS family aminotransferase [Geothrix sp. 21YS21S-4]